MARKSPMDLLNESDSSTGLPDRKKPEAPISVVLRNFMSKSGEELELTTRMNGPAVKAAQVSFIFETMLVDPVSEESLILGTVDILPESIKKWIAISDEVVSLRGEEFLRYIYDELAYQIAKKAADEMIARIIACGTASTTTCPGVPVYTATVASVGLVAQALSQLSDEAANPTIVMNKASWGSFKAAQAANGYLYDPFEGLPVVFNNSLPALGTAATGATWMIVGDFEQGALANLPNGDGISFKFDEMTLATNDLIRVIGREFVGLGVVAPNAFVKVKK